MSPRVATSPVILPCDVCGRDLARLKDLRDGWVMWWTKDGVVQRFLVTCHKKVGRCLFGVDAELASLRGSERGWGRFDHHLSVFTGKNAV